MSFDSHARKHSIVRAFWELHMQMKRSCQFTGKQLGLSYQQLTLMWHLGELGQPSMSEMADVMECEPANLTGIVDKLEARGVLQRVRSSDRRVKLLELTEEGKALRADLVRRMDDPPSWLDALGPKSLTQLDTLLQSCLQAATSGLQSEGEAFFQADTSG